MAEKKEVYGFTYEELYKELYAAMNEVITIPNLGFLTQLGLLIRLKRRARKIRKLMLQED